MTRPQSRFLPVPHLFIGVSISAFLMMVLAMAAPAAGEVVEGNCTGTVTMEGETVVDAQQPGPLLVTIPDRGTAEIAGGFELQPSDEPVAYRGELQGRHPFGSWVIASWTGQSTTPGVVASQSYALPNVIPQGSGPVPLTLDVSFGDDTCRIVGSLAVAGPRFDGLTSVLLLATLLFLTATTAAGRRNARGFGRPLVGMITGLLAGVTGAATLFGAGAISLDSNVWWYAPVVLAALGLALGTLSPFGRRRQQQSPPVPEIAPDDGSGQGSSGDAPLMDRA